MEQDQEKTTRTRNKAITTLVKAIHQVLATHRVLATTIPVAPAIMIAEEDPPAVDPMEAEVAAVVEAEVSEEDNKNSILYKSKNKLYST